MTKEFDARNAAKSRKVCEAMAERADTGKRVLTERERRLIHAWPRHEGSERPVWLGDSFADEKGEVREIEGITLYSHGIDIFDDEGFHKGLDYGERVKRPVQSVLDADGVEIHKGEILQGVGRSQHLFKVLDPHHVDPEIGEAFSVRCIDLDDSEECHCRPGLLTHTRTDSWERLEEDAGEDPFRYCKTVGKRLDTFENAEVFKSADIVRRAKKLAGVSE